MLIIQLPSANPPPCLGRGMDGSTKRSIGRSIDRSIPWMLGPFFRSSGGRCGTLGGSHIDPQSMKNHRKSTQNRPQIDRNRPQTVKNRTSGTLWATRGVRGRKLMENVGSWVLARAPILGHLGDIWHHLADIFSVFGCKVDGLLDDRRFDGKSVRKWTAGCG